MISLEYIFTFGKYKGQQFEDICHDDPNYIEYLIDNDIVDLDEEAMEFVTKLGIA